MAGNLPHFYYYYVGNPSEAMIAKRRSFVTLISYQAPPLKKSGLYGEYQELKETIAEYRESLQSAPERSQDLLEQIGRLVSRCHLEYAGESTDKNLPESDLDKIESCLYTYENSLSTEGLHTINEDEIRGLFHAFDGGYMPVGTAGDVIKNPDILLCDEPTGALDYNTSKDILKLIETVNQKYGNTVIMVTHNDAIKDMADRVVKLRDGMIRKNYQNEHKIPAMDLDW